MKPEGARSGDIAGMPDGVYFQICSPVVGFTANTSSTPSVTYITPLTTSGVISIALVGPPVPVWKTHASFSWETLAGVIWSMLWNREFETSFPLAAQSSSWANNGSMLNAQQSNAIAHFHIDIGKLN